MGIEGKVVPSLTSASESRAEANPFDEDAVMVQLHIRKSNPPMQPIVSEPCRLREDLQRLGLFWSIFCFLLVFLLRVCTHIFAGCVS